MSVPTGPSPKLELIEATEVSTIRVCEVFSVLSLLKPAVAGYARIALFLALGFRMI